MVINNINNFSCRIHFIDKNKTKILVDAKISIAKDKFLDNIGFLVIAQEVKGIKQLKIIYKITDRESEIIQDIIYGMTNKEISNELSISERTIKTHITNIYNKLGIDNKIQLINLLKDFDLIPQYKTD